MSELRKSGVSYGEALGHIDAHVEANRSYYSGLAIQCVSILQNETWRNVVCIVRAEPTESRLSIAGSRRYRAIHLLEEHCAFTQLARLVRELPNGTITVDGEAVFVGEHAEFHGWELCPSNNDYSDLPGYVYQSSQSSSVYPASLQEPLVDVALPYYPGVSHAVPSWVRLRRFHRFSDARIGYVWLFLPECRGRFSGFEASGNRLSVTIATGAQESARKFHLKGSWETPRGLSPISLPFPVASVETVIPDGATSADLYLVDETDTIFDFHRETPHWTQGLGRILPSSQEMGGEASEEYPGVGVTNASAPRRVFIVHGRDEANLLRLEKMLREQFGLNPVILRYQPGKGRTLIEKFEEEAGSCSFAFVLLGPDDQVRVSRGSGAAEEYTQARPNVVFEAGWFYGRLGRTKVCILHKRGTRIHSDLDGISRIPFDENVEAAFLEIKRELEAAEIVRPQ